jgi:hypothetical protein
MRLPDPAAGIITAALINMADILRGIKEKNGAGYKPNFVP